MFEQSLGNTRFLAGFTVVLLLALPSRSQVNVVTQHNDSLRTGQNVSETILTPANVNTSQFGRLFSLPVNGSVYAQPLYVQNVNIPGKGMHNVVFVATEHDSVYAFDADENTGVSADPLWQISLLDSAHGAASGATTVPKSMVSTSDISPEIGITGTPAIDAASGIIYVVGKSLENGKAVQRLHALNLGTGAEVNNGPVTLKASVSGNGNGSSGGVLSFDPLWENHRPGLLLLNGTVFLGFAAHGDNGPWHGWILSYDAKTLQPVGAYCPTANGSGSGFWMSGAGLAADPNSGQLFVTSGNGSFNATPPYTNAMNYGDDVIRLNNNSGVLGVGDMFTPYNQASLSASDQDFGSGGLLLLPNQSGEHTHLAVQVGKSGTIYVLDRDNLGGFNSTTDNSLQKISNQIAGLWSTPAYWNYNVYMAGNGDYLKAFSTSGSGLSSTPVHNSSETFGYPGATPSVSANGNSDGIVWTIQVGAYPSGGPAVLEAHDAGNLSTLYRSDQNSTRDNPGGAVKFSTPTIANGKVYVGTTNQVSVYGLINNQQATASPVFSPNGGSFNGSVTVTITDATSSASIYYTTDGSTPSTSSTLYTAPLVLNSTTTVKALAIAAGYGASAVVTATYTAAGQVATPTFAPAGGTYSSAQNVTFTDSTPNAVIYYTVDGSTPTTNSPLYTGPLTVTTTTKVQAIAAASGLNNSLVASATYTIQAAGSAGTIDFGNGFSNSAGLMTFNGSTGLDDTRLQLTNGGQGQAGSAFYNTAVNIQAFTTDFAFQLSNPAADGATFTIQGVGPTALGPPGGGLGYGPLTPGGSGGIGKSIAVKLDFFNNQGEGSDSTGLYQNGASPTVPAIDLSKTGINLASGDTMSAHLTYDGKTLSMTITDGVAGTSYSTSWTVDIPSIVGANTAYVGFTGGTGGLTSSQKIETWTFASTGGSGVQAAATPVFSPVGGTYSVAQSVTITDATSQASIYYTKDGSAPTTASTLYTGPISITSTTTLQAIAVASGFSTSATATATYTIQGNASIDFSNGFSNAASSMAFNGSATIDNTSLQLTSDSIDLVGSAFYKSAVNIQTFTTDFTFQLVDPNADGITFIIQGIGPTAIGSAGGGLGYGMDSVSNATTGVIGKSVAVKFDLYNNTGEGSNSTGLYLNGASPTTPSVDLSNTGIDLHSGDTMSVHLAYDGQTLSMTLTDGVAKAVYAKSWTVDIPSTVGGSTAFVGFTGATGGSSSNQEIKTWTFASTDTP